MPEIAVMREGQWWLRTGDDAEQPRTLGHWPADRAWVDLLRADVNGDGLDDLIGRDAADGRWWASRSTGWEFDTGIVGAWSNSVDWEDVHAADVNGDGLRDVVGRADGRWWVALSDGERLVNRRWGSWSSSADWHHVRVADVNGDGLDDVVGLANDKWWVAVSDGTRFHNTVWGAGPWAANSVDVLVADVNGDGRDDLVGRHDGTWWVALSDGERFVHRQWGRWSDKVTWEDVLVADIDADGRDDVVGRAKGSWWVARSVDGRFQNERWGSWADHLQWTDVSIVDVDVDGRDDVVGRVASTGDWWVARSTGAAFENLKWIVGSEPADTVALVGDFSLLDTKYLRAVTSFFDVLMTDGTDRYGDVHSPMFASILDIDSRRIPDEPPPLLDGQRNADRAFPGGNMQQDMVSLLTMYHLSQWSAQQRYAQAADAYLQFFLDEVAPSGNGLFPAGEHAFWDFRAEAIGNPTHEELGFVPREFLDHLWRLNPAAVERHVRSLRRHIVDELSWYWNRHAPLDDSPAHGIRAIPRHGAIYLYQWSYLFQRTGDAQLLDWATRTAEVHWQQRHPVTGNMPYFVVGDPERNEDPDKAVVIMPHAMAMGTSLLRANELLGAHAADSVFAEIGEAWLSSALRGAPHSPRDGEIYLRIHADGTPYEGELPEKYGFWDSRYNASGGYGFQGAERLAIQMLNAYRLTGNEDFLQFAKDTWSYYDATPPPAGLVLTPGKYAGLLALLLDLHEIEGDDGYLNRARQLADQAIDQLLAGGLFRAATGAGHYESANGPGSLAMELFRLHLTLTDSDYSLPRNYWDV